MRHFAYLSTLLTLFDVYYQDWAALQICKMAEPAEGGRKSRRQSGEPALHEDHFPPLKKINPPDKLPTKASVIGKMRSLCTGGKMCDEQVLP